MKGTITLKIVCAPNTKTEVLIENAVAEMPAAQINAFHEMVVQIEETINKLNGFKEE